MGTISPVWVIAGRVGIYCFMPMTRRIWLFRGIIAVVFIPLALAFGAGEKSSADVTAVLMRALKEKRVATFTYHGYSRTVEVHALGKSTDGKAALLAWQTSGGSQTEPPPGWRTFLVAEITGLELAETTFSKARPDYHKGGRGFSVVEAEVAAD